jgi:hypothetical protein
MSTPETPSTHFPVPILSLLAIGTDEPTYDSIREARTQLNSNAASVVSTAGGGLHGHLALTLTQAEYQVISPVPFVVPPHPGTLVHAPGASGPQQAEAVRLHRQAFDEFRIYHSVDQALRNQLIVATPPTFIQTMKDPVLGFGQVSCLDLITHLRSMYGTITPEALDKNLLRMSAAWHPPTPIEDLFEQLRAGRAFAIEGGDATSVQTQVRLGYNIIFKTGVFNQACREWRNKPTADHTFPIFQTHFKQWDRDRRLTDTAGSAG